ncbi:MAG: DUF2510 domain-containing protein, partial [Dermatophilaceae bacterium]
MTGAPSPGWHADPHAPGRLRWWDGTRWTEHTHPAGVAATGLGPGRVGPQRPGWLTWPVVTVAVLLLMGSCTVLGTLSTDEASLETARSQPVIPGTTGTASPTATSSPSAPPASSAPPPAPTATVRPPTPSARPPAPTVRPPAPRPPAPRPTTP